MPSTPPLPPVYLGDSVYMTDQQGGAFTIYLNNGDGGHSEIFLEDETVRAMDNYIQKCREYYFAQKNP